MTLQEFQNSTGIAVKDTIFLINNPVFTDFIAANGFREDYSYMQQVRDFIGVANLDIKLFYGSTTKSVDSLDKLFGILSKSKRAKKITLLIGKGDYEITDTANKKIPENVTSIIANNINTANLERLSYLPMGRDFRSFEVFDAVLPSSEKDELVYANFSLNTHPIRPVLNEALKELDFVKREHMGGFLDYPISRTEFYKTLSKSKFVVCPRGNGIDTFRLWDSLYLGAIPIVVREAVFHESLIDLPILFLDSYDDFKKLNREILEETYIRMLNREYNYEKLKLSFWLQNIN